MNFHSRRQFLKCSSAAALLAAIAPPPLLAETPAKRRALKKGFMMGAFPEGKTNLPLLEKFKLLKEAGFDGAEPPSHLDEQEVLAARDATGLLIASVSSGKHTRSMSEAAPSVRKRGSDGLIHALRNAKTYGADSVLCVAGVVDEKMAYADTYKRTQEAIREAIPVAEELGVKIAIENVWNNFLLSPLEAARYVDEFKSPAVAWHFDIGNVMNIGWPEHWIRILGKRIAKVHVKEFSRKKMTDEGMRKGFAVEYLEGENDWPAVMKALDGIGYTGWFIAEPAYRPNNVDPGERLKQIAERMDRILAS